jgi:4-hydroxy-3-methylbut-2-enyl diphosphate reductase
VSLKNWDNRTWLSSSSYIKSFNKFLIEETRLNKYSKISITAGASAPESKVMEIAKSLELYTDAEIIEHGEDNEDIYFKLPPGLR